MKLFSYFFSLRATVICLFYLCFLIFVGTVYQSSIGLHHSLEKIFYAWFFRLPAMEASALPHPVWGIIPLPGGMLVMTLLFVNLLISLLVHFKIAKGRVIDMSGVILMHIGVLVMLAGGAFNMMAGWTSYQPLYEGESTNLSRDYSAWELSIATNQGEEREVHAVDIKGLKPEQQIDFDALGLTLTVEEYIRDAKPLTKSELEPDVRSVYKLTGIEPVKKLKVLIEESANEIDAEVEKALAESKALFEKRIASGQIPKDSIITDTELELTERTVRDNWRKKLAINAVKSDPQRFTPGMRVTVAKGSEAERLLLYGVKIEDPEEINVSFEGTNYFIGLRAKRRELPVEIKLDEFTREALPNEAKHIKFQSEVAVTYPNTDRTSPALIEMNAPFRTGGYTFYQGSFNDKLAAADQEFSSFVVTYNPFRIWPYWATAITFIGMFIHFIVMLSRTKRKKIA